MCTPFFFKKACWYNQKRSMGPKRTVRAAHSTDLARSLCAPACLVQQAFGWFGCQKRASLQKGSVGFLRVPRFLAAEGGGQGGDHLGFVSSFVAEAPAALDLEGSRCLFLKKTP